MMWYEQTRHIPIIMLSARDEESVIVTGLELGADDYIVKPFSARVLIARIRKALNRSQELMASSQKTQRRIGSIEIVPERY